MTKRSLLALHKYCGLVAALLILVQALSGMTLVYRDGLARWLQPGAMIRQTRGAELAPGVILRSAQRHFPGAEIRRLVFPKGDDGVYFVWMAHGEQDMLYATIDPGNGAMLSSGGLWRYPVEAALSVHFQLFGGKTGTAVVVLTGLSLLCLIFSGLAYWWPRGNRVLKALAVRRDMPARFVVRQLHRTAGVVVSVLLCVSATTGLVMLAVMLMEPGARPAPAGVQRFDGADRAFALARAQFPGHAVRDIRMQSARSFNVYFRTTGRNPESVSAVSMDLPSLRVMRISDARTATDPFVTLLSIHNGTLFGNVGLVIVFILGAALAFLAITGPLGWYLVARRQWRSAAAQRARS